MNADMPRFLLAAPASGGGKTTLTIGLLRALLDRGLRPAAFKCGPDYIDPLFHRETLGVPGGNLDLFLSSPDIARGLLCDGARGADAAVIEGVMGYYDGIGESAEASSWALARETKTPTVLALNPRGAFLSLAALVKGFREFRRESGIAALILNRCGESHCDRLKPLLERETGLPVLGCLPDMPEAELASRHLGLVTPDGVASLREKTAAIARRLEKSVDIDALLALAASAPPLTAYLPRYRPATEKPVRIAVALDAAFCFHYRENLDLLRSFGAEIAFFSPLADAALPPDCGGLYLGGGYPELHAGRLAANAALLNEIRERVAGGLPTLAECGGFLYLQETLRDAEGAAHAMVGVLPGRSENSRRLGRFGYLALTAETDNLLCAAGETIRVHEFHYWDSDRPGEDCLAVKPDGRNWSCCVARPSLFAGFPHLYLWSNPRCAGNFVKAAAGFAGRETA